MSNILKEPYQISVWEDELIPEETQYAIKGENDEFILDSIITKKIGETLSEEEIAAGYQIYKVIMEHFEETRGLVIGAHDMTSRYAAANAQLKTNTNGNTSLTFTMYYKIFDEDIIDFVANPLAAALSNEKKIKLFFRNKWYDMVIKNCVEDSASYSFTYTCSDIYINELSKNGFKVELDTELENSQGTITKVAETILDGTDWHVAPVKEEASPEYEGIYSDIIIQTNIEPLYKGVLNQSVEVELVNSYTPDEYADMNGQFGFSETTIPTNEKSFIIPKGEEVYFFYSEINKNATQPQILYRNDKNYLRDVNEDIITNAYNYKIISPEIFYVDKTTSYNVPNICYSEKDQTFEIYNETRGEKVIKSAKTSYDPNLDQFVTIYKKDNKYYYGYTTLETISSNLATNYLANSDNFIGIDSGWIFDGTPTAMNNVGDGTVVSSPNVKNEDATFTGQIHLLNQKGFSYDKANAGGAESVMIMKLQDGGDKSWYKDNNGDFYGYIKSGDEKKTYVKLGTSEANSYETQITAFYKQARANGIEQFATMSDEELQRAIDSALRNSRYSTRVRRSVNTGVAANRKQIGNLTQGEEYVFAVSLGQYTGDNAPKYGDEIRYGAKTPTELYSFEDINESIIDNIEILSYGQAVNEIENNFANYLEQDEYGNITDKTYTKAYNDYLSKKEAEYAAIYLEDFGLLKNLIKKDTINKNECGGKNYRNKFKAFLKEQFSVSSNSTKSIIDLLQDCKNEKTENYSYANYLYEKAKELFSISWEKTKEAAEKPKNISDALWAFKKISWEQAGCNVDNNNEIIFPTFNENCILFAEEAELNCFCDFLYTNLIKTIYDKYVVVNFDENEDGTFDDVVTSIIIPTSMEIDIIVERIFDQLVDRIGVFGALKAAYEYKKPSILNPKGGEKYQQHLTHWKKDGHQYALEAALNSSIFKEYYAYVVPAEDYSNINFDFLSRLEFLREKTKKELDAQTASSQIDTIVYEKELINRYDIAWKTLASEYSDIPCGSGFAHIYFKAKEAKYDEAAQTATYTISREEYTPTFVEEGGKESPIIPIQNEEGEWIVDNTYRTSLTDAEYVAYEDDDKGFYIFDKQIQKIRLFNPETDGEKAKYLPIKNSNGAYIYDDIRQVYRKYRDWASNEYRNPATKEILEFEKGGVAGDITYHDVQMFDGHLGKYKEIPVRYNMIRTFEDKDAENRKYLSADYSFEFQIDGKNYEYILPAGYQLDQFVESPNDGFYVRQDKTMQNSFWTGFLGIFGISSQKTEERATSSNEEKLIGWGFTDETETIVVKLVEGIKGGFKKLSDLIEELKSSIFKDNLNKFAEIHKEQIDKIVEEAEKNRIEASDIGLSIENTYEATNGNEKSYVENRPCFFAEEEEQTPYIPNINDNKTRDQLIAAGRLKTKTSQNIRDREKDVDDTYAYTYVKYRPWYWRHWGQMRYDLREKICVVAKNGSDEEYKVFNNIHDAVSKNYSIAKNGEISDDKVAFYLKDKVTTYRTIEDTDYSPYAYEIVEDEKMDKAHLVRNDSYNYYRPYQDGDASIKLFDGHFGFWCQTYEPKQLSDQNLKEKGAWMLIGGRYIPYDIRLYNIGLRKFRRIKITSNYSFFNEEQLSTLFTYCDGEYISLRDYYDKNTKINHLDYSGLKVYFTPEYKYDPTNFALEINQSDFREYLGLEITEQQEPDDYFDTIITSNSMTEEEVRERWAYWKIKVNKSFSLTDDLLSSIGIVFEKSGETKRKEDFAFLGMQLFKYIPYRSNKQIEETKKIEEGTIVFEQNENSNQWILVASDNTKLQELMSDIPFPEITAAISREEAKAAAKEYFDYLSEGLKKTDYVIEQLKEFSDELDCDYILYKTSLEEEKRPIIPSEAPDARDLTLTTYHIYNPELKENSDSKTAIFDYKGQYPEEEGYEVVYDELCQKIRSVKGKESNYFKLLQDSCDTFDCWMEIDVEHEPQTGRIIYEERKVYLKDPSNPDAQVYFDQLPKDEIEKDYFIQYMIVPKKTIRFKRFVGKENWSGFKYGTNLKHIKRTIDSNQITSRIIVKPNKNEFATDGFCTIQRADENFIKENFIYDFSYYVNKGLLSYNEIIQDLYTSIDSSLGYYAKLGRLNKENDQIILDLAATITELDKVNANYETAVLGRDAANEEIQKLMQTLVNNYDIYGNIQLIPWEYNKSKEVEQKTTVLSPARSNVEITTSNNETYYVDIPAMVTELEYPKYNETLRAYFDQMDTYMRSHINFSKQVESEGERKTKLEAERDRLLALEQEIITKKEELNKLFYVKYARFIQEGSWIDEDYVDDNLYYLDALAVLRNSCSPKISYDVGIVDLYAAIDFEEDKLVLDFELGDRTYIEDTEFFGYTQNNKPFQEQIVIAEKIYSLDDASQNQIKVKNYSTQFDNLFQRAAATSQTLQFNEGSYGRASSVLNEDGTINANVLQQSIKNTSLILQNSLNENVRWDNTGITVTSYSERSNVIKIVSAGILLSNDGGNSYLTAITGDGVNAAIITGGTLNIDKLMIGASSTPNFLWNKAGISSFKTKDEEIDYSTFVRLDQYGIYGIKDWNKEKNLANKMSINDTFEPLSLEDVINNDKAIFGLTWDGFFLNTNADGGRGRVTIGTQQDIRMSVLNDAGWQDRVIIGRMSDTLSGEQTYGFRLVNEDNEIVMDTNLRGELYLKRKLRISSFLNETILDQQLTYDEKGNVIHEMDEKGEFLNGELLDVDDRIALGIVDVYNRKDYDKNEPSGLYSSTEYLTKIFSVKVNNGLSNDGAGEQFNQDIIEKVVDRNETFAIFDNGNLYAKNAWIEGNIRASSGKIFGSLEIGPEDTQMGELKHSDDNWIISGDGTASFKNVNVSGTISSATFEYDKIQTIAGSMIIFPAFLVEKIEQVENPNIVKIYLQMSSFPQEILNYSTEKEELYVNFSTFSNYNIDDGKLIEYKINKLGTDKMTDAAISENAYIEIDIGGSTIFNLEKNTPVSIRRKSKSEADLREVQDEVLGIVLNASENGTYPKQSISIVDLLKTQDTKPKAVLGYLDSNFFNSEIAKNKFGGTFGLYSDNVYLKGTIISENDGKIGGITTNNLISSSQILESRKDLSTFKNNNIVFFAGSDYDINKLKFFVTDEGRLYAQDGYFTGIIEASEIRGGGKDSPGLTFRDLDNAIHFVKTGKENKADSTIFNLSSDAAIFYKDNLEVLNVALNENPAIRMHQINENNNEKSYLFSIEKEWEESAQDYKVLFKYKNSTAISLTKDGAKFGDRDLSIDKNAYFENVYITEDEKKTYIGCNVIII